VERRYELARQKLQSGNYPGFEAAELLYRQILAERDDPLARALRARTLAQMTFEFGDAPDLASRAVASLGALASPEADEARTYLALARGDLDRGARMATTLRRKAADPTASYLVGRAELLLEHPDAAVEALKIAVEKLPRDPLFWHGLGLAQAAAHHDDLALDAYRRALDLNSNHIATLIDRAVLEVRDGTPTDRDAARAQLDGVTTKLVGDSSPGQLARAFLAIGELELANGELDGARRALASAVAKRRDGDALLSEELASAFLRALELDQAEKEAKRAVAGFGSSARLQPRLVLARVALARGRAKQALTTIDEAGTSRPEALVLRALANLQLGRRDAARFDAESALRVQPDLVAAKVVLARVEIADGHSDRAQKELDQLEHATTKLPEVASALGMVFAARFPERAKFWFNQALMRDPLAIEPRLELARLFRAGGKLDDAKAQLDTILQQNPQYVPAQRERAGIALDQGDTVAARDQYDALVDKAPDFETLIGAARAHLALGDFAGAQDRATRAAGAAPNPIAAEESNDLAARALLAAKKPAEVAALLRKIAPTAQRGETGGLLLLAYLALDQQDKAAEVRLIVPPRLRLSPEMLMARARLEITRGRDVAAESLALAALAKLQKPTAPRFIKAQTLTVLGRSRWEQGSFGAALKSLRAACTLDPKNPRAFYYLGMVLDDVGKKADARAAMETAVANDGQFADALYSLGRMREDAGDPKAADPYRKYLEVAPKGIYAEDVRRALAGQGKVRPTNSAPRRRRRGR
jgi:tetratricopeptide (TPR) repeat protein